MRLTANIKKRVGVWEKRVDALRRACPKFVPEVWGEREWRIVFSHPAPVQGTTCGMLISIARDPVVVPPLP